MVCRGEAAMLLTIDVGNTNTVLGLMKGTSLEARVRIRTVERTTDEIGVLLLQAFGQRGVTPDDVSGAIIGSVVPSVLYSFDKACRRYFAKVVTEKDFTAEDDSDIFFVG